MSVEIQKSLRSDGFTKDSTSQISSLNKNCFLLPKIFKGLKSDEDVGHSINQLFFNAIRLTVVKIIKLLGICSSHRLVINHGYRIQSGKLWGEKMDSRIFV